MFTPPLRLVDFTIAFLSGVMVTLTIIGLAVHATMDAERHIGACEAACAARGFDESLTSGDDHCRCMSKISASHLVIDPHEEQVCPVKREGR